MSRFARLVAGLRPFLRDRISTDQARTYVRTQLERRPDLFLEMLAQKIYARPGHGGTLRDKLSSLCVHGAIRCAARFPRSTPAPFNDPWRVGEPIARLLAAGHRLCLVTSPSAAVRLSLAAQSRGMSLRGLACLLGSEPVTPARRDAITASGATAVASYGLSEAGGVGCQCPQPDEADDVHVFEDAFAIIQRELRASRPEPLLLTALRPACPKVLLNTEIGDSALLVQRRCDCLFGEVGYHQRPHTIRSFTKLTGEGVTIAAADLYPVLERSLPARFGGSLADYQLVERQDDHGLTRYTLLVSPDVGPLDEAAVVSAFLDALVECQDHYRLMTRAWREAHSVDVQRRPPVRTERGKALPFRTLGRDQLQ